MKKVSTTHPLATGLLKNLISLLDERDIKYCILRNYEKLPDEIGNDIDILIKRDNEEIFEKLVRGVAEKDGWSIHKRRGKNYFIFYRYENEEWIFLRIDAVVEIEIQSFEYMSGEAILSERRKNEKGIYILSQEHEVVHLLVHTLFGPKYNRLRYKKRLVIVSGKKTNFKEVGVVLTSIFGANQARDILNKIKEGDIESILGSENVLWNKFLLNRKYKAIYIKKIIVRVLSVVFRRIFPPGKFVVIVGPDGAGKSTTAEHMHTILKGIHIPVKHMHLGFRPCVLPTRNIFKNNNPYGAKLNNEREIETPGLIRFLYYTLDYFLGYFIKIRPLLVRGYTVLGERYYYNFLVDPRPRKQMKFPLWLPKFCYMFMPKPHTMLLLSNNPNVIYKRRQEHSVEEIKRQIKLFRIFGKRLKRFLEIRTDISAENVAILATQKVTAYRLAILVSHPIQYQAPLFRELAKDPRIDLMVYYCWDFGIKEEGYEPESGARYKWDIPLLEGYEYKFLTNISINPSAQSFFGQINPSIVKELWKNRYDALLVHGYSFLTDWLAFFVAFFLRTPIFMRGITHLLDKKPWYVNLAKRLILYPLFASCESCLYIGTYNKEYYKKYGVQEKKLFHTPHIVDNDFFADFYRKLSKNRDKIRKEFGFVDEAPVVLFLSRLVYKKQPERVLNAYKEIRKKIACGLLVVGEGPLRKKMEEQVSEYNIPNVVFTGFLNQTEIPKAYVSADVFTLPSIREETWGLVVNEAMNFNLPIIVSDKVGCGKDIVLKDKNGYIVNTNMELKEALFDLIKNKNKRQEFGLASKKIITEWNIEKTVRGVVRALEFSS